jgi:hypothetical protein
VLHCQSGTCFNLLCLWFFRVEISHIRPAYQPRTSPTLSLSCLFILSSLSSFHCLFLGISSGQFFASSTTPATGMGTFQDLPPSQAVSWTVHFWASFPIIFLSISFIHLAFSPGEYSFHITHCFHMSMGQTSTPSSHWCLSGLIQWHRKYGPHFAYGHMGGHLANILHYYPILYCGCTTQRPRRDLHGHIVLPPGMGPGYVVSEGHHCGDRIPSSFFNPVCDLFVALRLTVAHLAHTG